MIHYEYGKPTDHARRRQPDQATPAPVSEGDTYDFTQTFPDNRSIILAVAAHGPNLTGVELGLYQAHSFCTMLQVCTNVDKLIGVDNGNHTKTISVVVTSSVIRSRSSLSVTPQSTSSTGQVALTVQLSLRWIPLKQQRNTRTRQWTSCSLMLT